MAGGKKFYNLNMYLKPENRRFSSEEKMAHLRQKNRSLYDDKSHKRREFTSTLKTDYSEEKDSKSKPKHSTFSQKKKLALKINGLRFK